jgi:hypothetical protein
VAQRPAEDVVPNNVFPAVLGCLRTITGNHGHGLGEDRGFVLLKRYVGAYMIAPTGQVCSVSGYWYNGALGVLDWCTGNTSSAPLSTPLDMETFESEPSPNDEYMLEWENGFWYSLIYQTTIQYGPPYIHSGVRVVEIEKSTGVDKTIGKDCVPPSVASGHTRAITPRPDLLSVETRGMIPLVWCRSPHTKAHNAGGLVLVTYTATQPHTG